jgi:hypothetical protein
MWPMFRTLFHRLSGKSPRKASRRRRPAFCRPLVEALEDRAVPASLSYSTVLNGVVYATAVDCAGNVYVTGHAESGFSPTPGAFDTTGSGAFVAKLSPTGTLIYATYLGSGGSGINAYYAAGTGIAVDAAGDAYVIGEQPNILTTANAIASSGGATGAWADFVAEVNPTGSGLLYATYLPSTINNPDWTDGYAGAIALGRSGNVDVAGCAVSGLPVTASAYQASVPPGGSLDGPYYAFFMKIDPALSGTASVVYSSYLGAGSDQATGIAVDGAGNAYLEGLTLSGNSFPITSGSLGNAGGNTFVAKFNPSLSGAASLVYSAVLGGQSAYDFYENTGAVPQIDGGIAVDSAGNAYVTSTTTSSIPTTLGAYQTNGNFGPTYNGFGSPTYFPGIYVADVFVTKLNATGSALIYSTYLGGGTVDGYGTTSGGAGIAVDANDDAYVTGWTNSTTFPIVNPVQATNSGNQFASFVTELNPTGSGLLFSTYMGGSGAYGFGIALDSAGNVYDGGGLGGVNYDPSSGFADKISLAPSPSFSVTGFPSPTTAGVAHTFTVTALNADGGVNTGYTGTVQFTSSDPQAVLPANYTFTAADQGVHTFTVALKTAGSQSITATDTSTGSITGSETGITVTPAAASKITISAPSSVRSGKAFSVTITILDAYGNVATGYTGTIHFSSSDSTAVLPANYKFTAADAGVHTFTNKTTLKKKGTQTLTVTDTQNSELTATVDISVG